MSNSRRRAALVLALFVTMIASCCCVTPALMSGVPIRPQVVQRVLLPAGDFEVVVSKRYAWGWNEWVDPAVVVNVELRRGDTGARLLEERLELVEDSDLDDAHVGWHGESIVVTGLDGRTPRTVRFDLPR